MATMKHCVQSAVFGFCLLASTTHGQTAGDVQDRPMQGTKKIRDYSKPVSPAQLGLTFLLPQILATAPDYFEGGWSEFPGAMLRQYESSVSLTTWPMTASKTPRTVYGLFLGNETRPMKLAGFVFVYADDDSVTPDDMLRMRGSMIQDGANSSIAYDESSHRLSGLYQWDAAFRGSRSSEYVSVIPTRTGRIVLIGIGVGGFAESKPNFFAPSFASAELDAAHTYSAAEAEARAGNRDALLWRYLYLTLAIALVVVVAGIAKPWRGKSAARGS
jgi:hypothetical protein